MDKYIGKQFTNNLGFKFTIIEMIQKTPKGNFYKVRFDSGYETMAKPTDFTRGRIKDYLSPSYCKVGIIGFANIEDKNNKRAISVWRNMLNRCYNPNFTEYKRYGEKGVTVCDRWKRLDYFLEDLFKIEGFDLELFNKGQIQLDKDIKQTDNKIYSSETCVFVSPQINAASSIGTTIKATNNNESLEFNSILSCARHFGVHRGIIERRLNINSSYNGWIFNNLCP